VTFTLASEWIGSIPGPNLLQLERNNAPGGVYFQKFDKVAVDPCDNTKGFLAPGPGPTVDDLVTALVDMPNIEATNPVDVTIGGYQGKQLTLTAPDSFAGCTLDTPGEYLIWRLPLGATMTMPPSQRTRVWILDVDGERLVIDTSDVAQATDQQRAEIDALLESVRLAPGG
jgi:hypothetical protein